MERKQMVEIAGLLGIKKNLSSDKMLVAINAKLKEINISLDEMSGNAPVQSNNLPKGKKPEDGRKGFHPITGKPVK